MTKNKRHTKKSKKQNIRYMLTFLILAILGYGVYAVWYHIFADPIERIDTTASILYISENKTYQERLVLEFYEREGIAFFKKNNLTYDSYYIDPQSKEGKKLLDQMNISFYPTILMKNSTIKQYSDFQEGNIEHIMINNEAYVYFKEDRLPPSVKVVSKKNIVPLVSSDVQGGNYSASLVFILCSLENPLCRDMYQGISRIDTTPLFPMVYVDAVEKNRIRLVEYIYPYVETDKGFIIPNYYAFIVCSEQQKHTHEGIKKVIEYVNEKKSFNVEAFAQELGLNITDFSSCMNDSELIRKRAEEINQFYDRYDVQITPTLIIENEVIRDNTINTDYWKFTEYVARLNNNDFS